MQWYTRTRKLHQHPLDAVNPTYNIHHIISPNHRSKSGVSLQIVQCAPSILLLALLLIIFFYLPCSFFLYCLGFNLPSSPLSLSHIYHPPDFPLPQYQTLILWLTMPRPAPKKTKAIRWQVPGIGQWIPRIIITRPAPKKTRAIRSQRCLGVVGGSPGL